MAAYWSGSAMLTASQDRRKLLMNDIRSYSLAMTTQFRLEVFRGRQRSDFELFSAVAKLKRFKAAEQRIHSTSAEDREYNKKPGLLHQSETLPSQSQFRFLKEQFHFLDASFRIKTLIGLRLITCQTGW